MAAQLKKLQQNKEKASAKNKSSQRQAKDWMSVGNGPPTQASVAAGNRQGKSQQLRSVSRSSRLSTLSTAERKELEDLRKQVEQLKRTKLKLVSAGLVQTKEEEATVAENPVAAAGSDDGNDGNTFSSEVQAELYNDALAQLKYKFYQKGDRAISNHFKTWDRDGSGKIDAQEFIVAMNELNLNVDKQTLLLFCKYVPISFT